MLAAFLDMELHSDSPQTEGNYGALQHLKASTSCSVPSAPEFQSEGSALEFWWVVRISLGHLENVNTTTGNETTSTV